MSDDIDSKKEDPLFVSPPSTSRIYHSSSSSFSHRAARDLSLFLLDKLKPGANVVALLLCLLIALAQNNCRETCRYSLSSSHTRGGAKPTQLTDRYLLLHTPGRRRYAKRIARSLTSHPQRNLSEPGTPKMRPVDEDFRRGGNFLIFGPFIRSKDWDWRFTTPHSLE